MVIARKIALEIITILLFILWIYAAVSKLADYETFKTQLGKSPLLTNSAGLVAIGIPGVELLIALALIFRRTLGLYASLFLMVMFTAYLIAILNFSYYIPCSCGGIIGKGLGWKAHIVFNLVFVCLSLLGILLEGRKGAYSKTNLPLTTNRQL